MALPKETIWVVIRLDLFHGAFDPDQPDLTITLKEAVPSREEAEEEARRLNALRDDRQVRYSVQPVRYFPEGRQVQVGY